MWVEKEKDNWQEILSKYIVSNLNPDIEVQQQRGVLSAIEIANRTIKDRKKEMIVVTGSIYMLGQAREYWYSSDELLRESEYDN